MKDKLIGFIIGGIVFGSIGVYAAIKMQASEISYKDPTVEQTLNSLYISRTNNDYSTDEKVVGKWIDGKPIYQKTMPISGTVLNDTWTNVNAVRPDNVDKIISYHSTNQADTLIYWQASTLYAASRSNIPLSNDYLTIQYTKTTD